MIRLAREDEVGPIIEMEYEELKEERAFEVGINFNYQTAYARCLAQIRDPALGFVLVAEDDDTHELVGGFLSVFSYNPGDPGQLFCNEVGWYVKPEHRGKGYGFKLLDEAIRLAWMNPAVAGMNLSNAITTPGWEGLVKKYVDRGFVPFQMNSFMPFHRRQE